jgi:hypothetical protein
VKKKPKQWEARVKWLVGCLGENRSQGGQVGASAARWDGTDTLSRNVGKHHTTPCNIPEERRSHQHHGRSLKSRFSNPVNVHKPRLKCQILKLPPHSATSKPPPELFPIKLFYVSHELTHPPPHPPGTSVLSLLLDSHMGLCKVLHFLWEGACFYLLQFPNENNQNSVHRVILKTSCIFKNINNS